MLQKSFFTAVAAALVALMTPAHADAYGAAHIGYTHVGPAGVHHYGASAARGPYGAYSGAHAGGYGAHYGAAYGAHYGGAYHYNTGAGGAYHYGAVHTGGYGYAAGVYRR